MSSARNTNRELWIRDPDDCFSPSIHVTESGGIGINLDGTVIVRPVEEWHSTFTDNFVYQVKNRELVVEIERLDAKIHVHEQQIEVLERENNVMRKLIAESNMDCVYCGLSKDDMAKCVSGFPGCGRADDMMV